MTSMRRKSGLGDKRRSAVGLTLAGLVGAVTTLLALMVTSLVPITQSSMVLLPRPLTPSLIEAKALENTHLIHIKAAAIFQNVGLKRGYVKDIHIKPIGLTFKPDVEVIRIDHSPIRFLGTRTVEFEFLLTIHDISDVLKLNKEMSFQAVYFDDNDTPIGQQSYEVRSTIFDKAYEVSWKHVTGATHYWVLGAADSTFREARYFGTVAGSDTSILLKGFRPGEWYYHCVLAMKDRAILKVTPCFAIRGESIDTLKWRAQAK